MSAFICRHESFLNDVWGVNSGCWCVSISYSWEFLKIISVNFSTKDTFSWFWCDIVREWPWQEEEKRGIDRRTTRVTREQAQGKEESWLMVGRLWPWHQPSAPSPSPRHLLWQGEQPSLASPCTLPKFTPHSQGRELKSPGRLGDALKARHPLTQAHLSPFPNLIRPQDGWWWHSGQGSYL